MGLLKNKERERLAAEVFLKTGVPVSPEDPIFAMVEILKSNQASQEASFEALCEKASQALKTSVDDLAMRSDALKGLIDSYLENRLEAANVTLDLETQRLKSTCQESCISSHDHLRDLVTKELSRLHRMIAEEKPSSPNNVSPLRAWIDSVWTLTACLAIGFMSGFIYFNGTIREPLVSQLERLSTKPPASAVTAKH